MLISIGLSAVASTKPLLSFLVSQPQSMALVRFHGGITSTQVGTFEFLNLDPGNFAYKFQ